MQERCRIFFWKVYHGRLTTNEYWARYGADISVACEICGAVSENVLHILRDCPAASCVWNILLPLNVKTRMQQLRLKEWVEANLNP